MTESFVTQCPHCQTRFRVTAAQLGMARGAVRCGACLQPFNAAEQLAERPTPASADEASPDSLDRPAAAVQDVPAEPAEPASAPAGAAEPVAPEAQVQEPPQPAEAPAAAPTAQPAADETLWIHDDLDLDSLNLELDEELAKLEHEEFELSSEFRDYQPTRAPFGSAEPPAEPHDESWVEALLNDQPAAPAAAQPQPALPLPAPAPAPVSSEEALPEQEARDEDFPELDDDADEAARRLPSGLSAARDDQPLSVSEAAATLGVAAAAGAAGAAAARSEPRLRDEGLRNLSDEPLQLEWQPPKPRWGRRLLWGLLILLALAGLGAQYVYFHLAELARNEQLRPWLEQACPLLGCQLPPRVDVSLIKSSNLTVRNHPTHPGALTVDAIIYNRAAFAQPFPLLELRFEDLNGQPLASRRFKPGEYLGGELAGRKDMPPQTPIHIALEILDPGAQAVNYSLAFHSPD